MFTFEYIELHKTKVEQDIQLAYADEINQVRALGFAEEYYVCEKHGAFTRFLEIDVVWKLSKYGGIWRTGPWWSLLLYGAFLLHEDGYAYATVIKNRIKFVTMFEDETLLRTGSFSNQASIPERRYIAQKGELNKVDELWQMHQHKVQEIADRGVAAVSLVNIHDCVQIERYIDDIMLWGKDAKPWAKHLLENCSAQKAHS